MPEHNWSLRTTHINLWNFQLSLKCAPQSELVENQIITAVGAVAIVQ